MLFPDRHEAALALGRLLDELHLDEPVVVGLEPEGVPIAREVAATLDAPLLSLSATPDRRILPLFDGRTVVIVAESLTAAATARSACRVARGAGATSVVLAVPAASFVFAELARYDADEIVVVELRPWFRSIDEVYGPPPEVIDLSPDPAADVAVSR